MNDKPKSEHRFVGTWIDDAEDTDVIFQIEFIEDEFKISGNCISDGEQFEVTNISFDGTSLKFETLMPSTNYKTKNKLTVREDGKTDLELSIFEVWKKKEK
ncbi:hypothetical protein P4C99_22230 [Pontiellaceae bacterium B1224]|nr:hypothetical protein [Pontiellaceae bacterium B1224]